MTMTTTEFDRHTNPLGAVVEEAAALLPADSIGEFDDILRRRSSADVELIVGLATRIATRIADERIEAKLSELPPREVVYVSSPSRIALTLHTLRVNVRRMATVIGALLGFVVGLVLTYFVESGTMDVQNASERQFALSSSSNELWFNVLIIGVSTVVLAGIGMIIDHFRTKVELAGTAVVTDADRSTIGTVVDVNSPTSSNR